MSKSTSTVAPSDPKVAALEALKKSGIAHSLESTKVIENSGWKIVLEEVPTQWQSEFPGKIEERVPDILVEYAVNDDFFLKAIIEFKKSSENSSWYLVKRRSGFPDFTAAHIRTNAGDVKDTSGVVTGVGWLDFPKLGYVHGKPQLIYDKLAPSNADSLNDLYKARRQLAVGERAVLEDEFTSLLLRKRINQRLPELTYIFSVIVTGASLFSTEINWKTDGSIEVQNLNPVDFVAFQSTRPAATMYQTSPYAPLRQREIFIRHHFFIVSSQSLSKFLEGAKTAQV